MGSIRAELGWFARLRPAGDGRLRLGCSSGRWWLAALAIVGCTPDAGSRHAEARRVVSLAPALTDLVFAFGAGERLVGRTRWDLSPPEARAIPSVGDGLDPNIEAVAARRPDLVLLYATPANARALAQFARLDIATLELPFDRLEHVPAAARVLGPTLGRGEAAESLAVAFETWLSEPLPPPRRRVAFVVAESPLITIGAGSFLTQLAARAGAENVFADLPQPSPPVSLEALVRRDPDALVLLGDSTRPPSLLERPEWRAVRAVRERRIVFLDGPAVSYPSVRAPEAVRAFREALERLP